MNPFAPEYVIFFICLVAGLLMMIVSAIGGGSHDGDAGADHDVDHDVGHDTDHDHDQEAGGAQAGLLSRAFSAIGVGRVPVLLLTMTYFLTVGTLGIFLNLMLVGRIPHHVLASHFLAVCSAVLITRFFAVRVSKVMPTNESYNVAKEDIVGTIGTAVFSIDETSGAAMVRDGRGDIFKITVRTTRGERISTGGAIVVVSYDSDGGYYVVTGTERKG